jgi:hypothetical protein
LSVLSDRPTLRDVVQSARSLEIIEEDGSVLRCDMDLVERMAAQGMTVGQIAALLGVSRSELRNRKAMADQLEDAVEVVGAGGWRKYHRRHLLSKSRSRMA